MKELFPMKPIITILNDTGVIATIFTPLSENEYLKLSAEISHINSFPKTSHMRADLNEAFARHHKFILDNIIAIGDTKIENRFANMLIEHTKTKICDTVKSNFKCFVNEDWKKIGIMNLPFHEDGGSSWNCLMSKLKNPKFGVIFKIPSENIKLFKLN